MLGAIVVYPASVARSFLSLIASVSLFPNDYYVRILPYGISCINYLTLPDSISSPRRHGQGSYSTAEKARSVADAVSKAMDGPKSGGTGAGKNALAKSTQTGRSANLSPEEQRLRDDQQKFVSDQMKREQERNKEFEEKAKKIKS